MRTTLAISVILNALLLGFILGDFARPIRTLQGLGAFSEHYPEEIRRDLRRNVLADQEAIRNSLGQLSATRDTLTTAMRAPDADRAELLEHMAEVRRLTTEVQERLQNSVLEAVLAAPAEVRAQIKDPGSQSDGIFSTEP